MKEDINGKAYRNIASKGQFLSFVCAYLNGDGGNIVIGAGADVAKLLASITPHAPVFFRKGDGEFYLVDVPSGNDKPYSCDGRFYVMRDDNAVPASVDEIKQYSGAAYIAEEKQREKATDIIIGSAVVGELPAEEKTEESSAEGAPAAEETPAE